MMKTYKINVNEEQALLIAAALDSYAKFNAGRIEDGFEACLPQRILKSRATVNNTVESISNLFRAAMFPELYTRGDYYLPGDTHHPEVGEAWTIHEALMRAWKPRHAEEEPQTCWGVHPAPLVTVESSDADQDNPHRS